MAVDIAGIVAGFDSTHIFFIVVIFILFTLAVKKVFRIVMNAVWIVVAAVLFPLFAGRVLGLDIPSDTDSILFFIVVGLGAYFLFLACKAIYSILGLAEKAGRKMVPKIERDGKGKGRGKYSYAGEKDEKPRLGKPIPKEYFIKNSKKSNDEFRDYVELGDKEEEKEQEPAHKIKRTHGDYVEIHEEPEKKEVLTKDIDDDDISGVEGVEMEPVKENKFKRRRKRK